MTLSMPIRPNVSTRHWLRIYVRDRGDFRVESSGIEHTDLTDVDLLNIAHACQEAVALREETRV